MSTIMQVYPLIDSLVSEQQGFYAVMKFMTILYELSLSHAGARTRSSSSFANIDTPSHSRLVHYVTDYIQQHLR